MLEPVVEVAMEEVVVALESTVALSSSSVSFSSSVSSCSVMVPSVALSSSSVVVPTVRALPEETEAASFSLGASLALTWWSGCQGLRYLGCTPYAVTKASKVTRGSPSTTTLGMVLLVAHSWRDTKNCSISRAPIVATRDLLSKHSGR